MKTDTEILDWLDSKRRENISIYDGEILIGRTYIGNPLYSVYTPIRDLLSYAMEMDSSILVKDDTE